MSCSSPLPCPGSISLKPTQMTILFFSLDIFFQKNCGGIQFSKSTFPAYCSRQTFETHQDAVENQSAEWRCIFLWGLLPLPLSAVPLALLWHFPEGCCLNDKQVKGQDSFKRNKISQKTMKGLSTAAEKYPPGVKRKRLNVQTELPSEAFKPSKVSLRFKAPFNLAWFDASLRALCAPAIRQQISGMWPWAVSLP